MTAAVNDSGTVLERYTYSPYGQVTFLNPDFSLASTQSSSINTHLFTGRELDSETGLQLNRNRYFEAHLGRWINRDPFGYAGGMNLYGYVDGNPLTSTNPEGYERQRPGDGPTHAYDLMREMNQQSGLYQRNAEFAADVRPEL